MPAALTAMIHEATASADSDKAVVDFLRRRGEATVAELASHLRVTATAVRQRLSRLMECGLIDRRCDAPVGRGRPTHRYRLTPAGARSGGDSYDRLAQVLWDEVRSVADPDVRQGLLARISSRLAESYRDQLAGQTLAERMDSLAQLMSRNNLPFEREGSPTLPVLTALACPFPDLAERDRAVCAMEKMLFSEILGEGVRLSSCRLDGASCCTFEASAVPAGA
ncbi:MAG TPA: MarR family transcriptional regulator [Lacipirellulaceae bacterium]|nr:MarR family transcriptional regulator [Lacipirellulaceae bacterium]